MNTLEMAKIFQAELDKQVVAGAVTGFMELNSNQIKYTGGNEIKVPKMEMDGLGDYNRATGYAEGAVTLSFETKTMTQDRGRSFVLDSMDIDETNFAASAGNVLGEFQRTHVIPEIDAYRLSKLATLAIDADKADFGYTPAVADVLAELKADIAAIKDVAGEIELVILMATPALAVLEQSNQISRFLSVGSLMKGDVQTEVQSLDGCPIISVPSARMKTAYTFGANGFAPAVGAKNVNWIVVPKTAPIAVSKTEKVKIVTPELNQDADAFKLGYRKYHDLFVMDNALEVIKVSIKEAE